jgi:hypothetical protein
MTEIEALGGELEEISATLISCDENDIVEALRAARRLIIAHRSAIDLGLSLRHHGAMKEIPIFYLFKTIINDLLDNFGLDSTLGLPVHNQFLLQCAHNIGKFLDSALSGDRQHSESMGYLQEAIRDYYSLILSAEEDMR